MDFVTILERFGFPAAILIGGSFAVWRVIVWFGANVANPLIKSHVSFLESIEKNLEEQTNCLREMSSREHAQTELLKSIDSKLAESNRHSGAAI